MSIYSYENQAVDAENAKKVMKDSIGGSDKDNQTNPAPAATSTGVAKEDGEERIKAFLDSIGSCEQKEKERIRCANDPIVKQRVLASQSNVCRDQCVNHMLGSMYIKSLPLDEPYKADHDAELRDDFSKYVKDNKGGALYYVKDADSKCNGTNILAKKMLEAADDEVKNFHEIMGIDFKGKSVDDIKFNLDNEIKTRLDNVTDEVSFNDIAEGIRSNVTKTAVGEIERAKKEASEQQALEEELAKNTDVTTESAAEKWMSEHRKARPKFYQPSLFEALMINKTSTMTESGSEFEEIFAESVKDYTKLSFGHSIGFEKLSPRDVQRIANSLCR